jgi:mono/diheme cytochrome c family protein
MRWVVLLVLALNGILFAQEKNVAVQKVSIKPTAMDSGKEMFAHYCAACHGPGGKGDGPAASAFKKAPRDLTKLAHDNGGAYPAAHVTAILGMQDCCVHGSKVMPVWGPILSSISGSQAEVQLRITNLVKYVESLQAP